MVIFHSYRVSLKLQDYFLYMCMESVGNATECPRVVLMVKPGFSWQTQPMVDIGNPAHNHRKMYRNYVLYTLW